MTHAHLVWSGIMRSPVGSLLTLVQITFAFALFGVLQGLTTGIATALAATHPDRLFVGSRVSAGEQLPIGYLAQLKAMSGVADVAYQARFRSAYRLPSQQVPGIATDPASYFRVSSELQPSSGAVEALSKLRSGAIVGVDLARLYGWKSGDRVAVQSYDLRNDRSRDWTFDIVGTYVDTERPGRASTMIFNYDYLNESRLANRDTATTYTVRVADPSQAARIAHEIDDRYGNSSNETRTQSEAEAARAEVQRIGDINYMARIITAAAFFGLVAATTAMLVAAVRARAAELATLECLGFQPYVVAALVVCEMMVLYVIGALLGLVAAAVLLPYAHAMIGDGAISASVIIVVFATAVVIALLSGTVPAWSVLRLTIVDALARR